MWGRGLGCFHFWYFSNGLFQRCHPSGYAVSCGTPDQAFEASHVAAINGGDAIGSSQRPKFGRDNSVRFVAASFGRIENEVL